MATTLVRVSSYVDSTSSKHSHDSCFLLGLAEQKVPLQLNLHTKETTLK